MSKTAVQERIDKAMQKAKLMPKNTMFKALVSIQILLHDRISTCPVGRINSTVRKLVSEKYASNLNNLIFGESSRTIKRSGFKSRIIPLSYL